VNKYKYQLIDNYSFKK